MTAEQLTTAYNIAIKYGFCGDCRWVHDNDMRNYLSGGVNAISRWQIKNFKTNSGGN